jgi:hypothetical protein
MTEIYRDKSLLKLAQDQFCLLRVKNFCRGGSDSTVACHHNSAISGKGMGIKAHDCWTAALCVSCHAEIDQGKDMNRDERRSRMDRAILMTLAELAQAGRIKA